MIGAVENESAKNNTQDEEEILPPPGMTLEDAKKALNVQVTTTGSILSSCRPSS